MKKNVVYTAIVGDYDAILQPMVVDDRFDYILFSDTLKEQQIGVWHVRPIPYANPVQTKIARWVKTHPEELLSDYPCSLWIDANLMILSPDLYDRCIELFQEGVPIASVQHPERNCIYEEAVCCMLLGFETETVALPWLHKIYKEGYPLGNGLTETNILFRIHDTASHFDRFWWQYIERYSRRDQLSFDYVLWKTSMMVVGILPKGTSARNSEWIEVYSNHKNPLKKKLALTPKDYPFLCHYKALFPYKDYWNNDYCQLYSHLYTRNNPIFWARVNGLYYWIWLKFWRPLKGKRK